MNNLFIDCSLGVSGDMLLAAFIDLGVPLDVIHRPLKILELEEAYSLIVEESKSFSLRGIKVSVKEKDSNEKYRNWLDIRSLIVNSSLPKTLKEKVLKIFKLLAEAESYVHGVNVDEVHFHELSCIDSLVDIVGVCSSLEYLSPEIVFWDYPPAGSGFVETSHGLLPVPVPAVLQLANKYDVKLISDKKTYGELTTPTGIALMIGLANTYGKPDSFQIDSIGIGLGHRELNRPNLLRACLLKSHEYRSLDFLKWEEIGLQESWIDDASPEDVSFLVGRLRALGALDVITQPIQMKKGRLGVSIKVLAKPNDLTKLRLAWFEFGTSIGVREKIEGRWVLQRRAGTCLTSYGKVFVKQVQRPDGKLSLKAEHDELCRISISNGISLEEVRKEIILSSDTFVELDDKDSG